MMYKKLLMQSWNKDGDSEIFSPFLPFHHKNPRSLLIFQADLQLLGTGRAILTIKHHSLLFWVSRHAVPIIPYFEYPTTPTITPPHFLSSISIHETHFKSPNQTTPSSLSYLGFLLIVKICFHFEVPLTGCWQQGVMHGIPQDIYLASILCPELERLGNENDVVYSWDVHIFTG